MKEGDNFFWTNDLDKGVGYLFEEEGKLFVQFTHYQREDDYWRESSDRAGVEEYDGLEIISERKLEELLGEQDNNVRLPLRRSV